MSELQLLLDNNRRWSELTRARDPQFFAKLAGQQAPRYLWIGCSDSRVPANEILGLAPGEVFVHRNLANLVVHTDLNCLSVIQYAVDVLRVAHIMVVGHHGCGGVLAALRGQRIGLADNWLRHVEDMRHIHHRRLIEASNEAERADRLCEINVVEQVCNVSRLETVQSAWAKGQALTVHGLVYGLQDGLLHDLGVTARHAHDLVGWRRQMLRSIWQPAA